jgi:myo-inositol 2-dehydrogenase/D-chiro-inositol 1-dehydrogenase
MTSKMPVGLIGLGRMGRIHAGNLEGRCRSAELAVVADADPCVAAVVGAEFDVPWTADLDQVLGDDSVRAVAVATPTATHGDLAVRAARAGKHVFCEKPIALDRRSGRTARPSRTRGSARSATSTPPWSCCGSRAGRSA